jgi:hypothetical protein
MAQNNSKNELKLKMYLEKKKNANVQPNTGKNKTSKPVSPTGKKL